MIFFYHITVCRALCCKIVLEGWQHKIKKENLFDVLKSLGCNVPMKKEEKSTSEDLQLKKNPKVHEY